MNMSGSILKNNPFFFGFFLMSSLMMTAAVVVAQHSEAIPESVQKDWEALTRDGGVWITHDNTDSYDAYGMKFSWGLAKKTVNGTLYVIKDKKILGTLFEYKIYYHPAEKKIVLEQYGSDGTLGVGEIVVFNDLKSENISTFYSPEGNVSKLKHVQQIMGDRKTSQTYTLNDKGEWIKSRYYEWKRQKESAEG